MNVYLLAFMVGLVALTRADVSHLKHTTFTSNALSPNDDQNNVSIKFNNAGNIQNSNTRYWWMNTENSPFTKTRKNEQIQNSFDTLHSFSATGSEKPTHNIIQDTQHQQQNLIQRHNQNRFQNVNTYQQQSHHNNKIYAHMAKLSGSPSEVNSLMQDTTHQTSYVADRYRLVQKIPCYGAIQVCALKDACKDGFIDERNLRFVMSQSNVSFWHKYMLLSVLHW